MSVAFGVDLEYEWDRQWGLALADVKEKTTLPLNEWRKTGRVSADKPNKEDHVWWQQEGLRQVKLYAAWLEKVSRDFGWQVAELDGRPGVEWEFEVEFGGINLRGYVDNIFLTPAQELVIVDTKTGSRTPGDLQLGVYAAAIERLTGQRSNLGFYFMTRKGELSNPVSLHHFTLPLIDNTFAALERGIQAGAFVPHVSDMCKGCGVRDFCAVQGGMFAWQFDPDHPDFDPDNF